MKQRSREFLGIMKSFKKLDFGIKVDGGNISHGEFMMLWHIEHVMSTLGTEEEGVNVSKLSTFLEASKPATSRMLSHLENKDLVERISDKRDRRVVFVRLTSKGVEILRRVKVQQDFRLDELLNQLGEEDTDDLIRIMNKLYSIIEGFYEKDNME